MPMGLINGKHGGFTEAKEIMRDQLTEEVIKSCSEKSLNCGFISKSAGSLKLSERSKPLCLYTKTGVKLFYQKILLIKSLIFKLNWRWMCIYSKRIMGKYRPRWTWKYLLFARKSIRMKRPTNLHPVSSQSITIIDLSSILCPGGFYTINTVSLRRQTNHSRIMFRRGDRKLQWKKSRVAAA